MTILSMKIYIIRVSLSKSAILADSMQIASFNNTNFIKSINAFKNYFEGCILMLIEHIINSPLNLFPCLLNKLQSYLILMIFHQNDN